MKRALAFSTLVAGALLASLSFAGDPKPGDPKAAAKGSEPPTTTTTLAAMMDGAKWNTPANDLVKLYNAVGGRFDQQYDSLMLKAQPGVQQKAIEADRDSRKRAFENSRVEFKDTPTGYDSTPLRSEYTYKNRESVMSLEWQGARTYFFFFGLPPGDRLWKIYKEVRLSEGGAFGNTYQECVTKLNAQLGVPARIRAADAQNGLTTTEADWQDNDTHLRALDRSRDKVCAIVLEHRGTLGNLGSLRAAKESDPFALDPSISNITKGGISDPNALRGAGSAKPGGKPPTPPPPPKK
jgi:hypothetical protein